jgi:hypothetical protein
MTSYGAPNLLILGCSKNKKEGPGSAIEVYDGPLFRTARRRLPEVDWPLDVWIISAKHGILRQTDWIEKYDEVLPTTPNLDFKEKVANQLSGMLPKALNRVLIVASKRYIAHLPIELIRARSTEFEVFSKSMGKCQSRLLGWLGINQASTARRANSLGPLKQFSNPYDWMAIHDAAKKTAGNRSVQWHALIEGKRIPAKKLVSVLTGAPVSSFETCHALALLQRNGIETCRVSQ